MYALRSLSQVHRAARGRANAKSVARQWLETAALVLASRNGPRYYQMAGLWERGRPWSDVFDHWSRQRYVAEVGRLNDPLYRKISQHKIAEKAMLTLMRIPTPRYIGVLDPVAGYDAEGGPLRDANDLIALFQRERASRVCFKLVEGTSGKGFVAADVLRDGDEPRFRTLVKGEVMSATELLRYLDLAPDNPRLIEEYLEQHPTFAALNPSSLNTLRLWVFRKGDRAVTTLGNVKVGRAGMLVDAILAGGMVAPVDFATGRVAAAHDGRMRSVVHPVHPDHGAPIEGVVLPYLAEACALAERAIMVFPHMGFSGFDVAVAPDGPRIIELNALPGREAPGRLGMTMREAFMGAPLPVAGAPASTTA